MSIIEAIRYWRYLLAPRRFTLVTDQRSVSFMFDTNIKAKKIKNEKVEIQIKSYRHVMNSHSVLRVVLTPQISRVIETLFFRSGWVVGITSYAQFSPIPSPLLSIFLKTILKSN